ncbi:MAG: MerR family transcriptional regulator [Bacilli bacterium]|jgi:uncharacterized HTH-type transcriptional regulator ydfL
MKNYFSIGEAAKMANTTTETLRHYDRINLLKPSIKDKNTKYRYYSIEDIVRLNTIHALQQMDLPLKDIKQLLDLQDLQKIIDFLEQAQLKADEKIASLRLSKEKIQLAKSDYENKLLQKKNNLDTFIQEYPIRVILLSDTLKKPSLDNLWNYLKHFYDSITVEKRNLFEFEDLAGIYIENNIPKLFALCTKYDQDSRLKYLPQGKYLCANCTEETKSKTTHHLLSLAKHQYGIIPSFIIEQIIITGILHWNYQIQIYIDQ